MSGVLVLVPALPLVAALGLALAGRRRPAGAGWIAAGALAAAAILILVLGLVTGGGAADVRATTRWFEVGGVRFTVGLELVPLTFAAAALVATIGTAVAIYAIGYVDDRRVRFFAWLCGFLAAMLALVLATSMLVVFVAWELVGLASWALIAHDRDDAAARRAGAKAFVVTRAGDVLLLVGWLAGARAAGTTDLAALVATPLAPGVALVVGGLVVAGVLGKSAQLPLSAWLPSAMIGPSPVSALLHSATMVAAGVFLLARLYPVVARAPAALAALAVIAAATAIAGALLAAVEHDLKRVLAWSTVAHLGMMMLAIALGGPRAAIGLLIVHAVYKAALFLAAGVAERARGRALDQLAGLARAARWTFAAFVTCGLALAAVPPLAGYVADEHVLAVATHRGAGWGALAIAVTACSAFGITRAALAWCGPHARELGRIDGTVGDPGWTMRGPLLVLAALAVVAGWPVARFAEALALPAPPDAPAIWRAVGIAASLAGIAGGWWVVARRGLSTRATRVIARLDPAIDALVVGPGRGARALAGSLDHGERRLAAATDRGGAAVADVASAIAAAEVTLAAATRGAATGVLRLARGVDVGERAGFDRGGDRLANAIDVAGGGAARLQAGKLYLYTLALFGAIAVVVVASVLRAI